MRTRPALHAIGRCHGIVAAHRRLSPPSDTGPAQAPGAPDRRSITNTFKADCNLTTAVAFAAAPIKEISVRADIRTALAIGSLITIGGCDQLRHFIGNEGREANAPHAAVWTAA